MDLREKKTLRAIRTAFLQLRGQRPLEKITVKELCELAEISKATFYIHYRDLYDLSERLQKEAVAAIYHSISHPDWAVSSPADFTRELFAAFQSQKPLIDILFSGTQESVLPKSIEAELRSHIFETQPELEGNVRFNTLLTYEVQGGYYSFFENRERFGDSAVAEEIVRGVQALSREMDAEASF